MISSERNVFLSVHVTKDVKEALREEALKTNSQMPSMSRVVYELLVEGLRARGYEIKEMAA